MPTYDMVCQDCEHKFTVFCAISEKEKQVCPKCKSSKISQRFTSVNIGGSKGGGGGCSGSSCAGCSGC
ncbi:zinc ribbon domain protein [Peptococcaceae bacterium CEB3]|nr:zinc ribbon domain protein [Peptococcaceae bacterium CEB3]